ncbi:MAG: hypothetical protein ACJA0P_002016 [Planctomycetota bacterium]|jgi:hypothetical protein
MQQTSGLLIHLDVSLAGTPGADVAVERTLLARGDVALGERNGGYWPAVLEAPTGRRSVDVVRELERVDGIAKVDVVFISTDEPSGKTT